jgi:hypothetical protein
MSFIACMLSLHVVLVFEYRVHPFTIGHVNSS